MLSVVTKQRVVTTNGPMVGVFILLTFFVNEQKCVYVWVVIVLFRVTNTCKESISKPHNKYNGSNRCNYSIWCLEFCSNLPPTDQLPDEAERTSCWVRLLVWWIARYGLLGEWWYYNTCTQLSSLCEWQIENYNIGLWLLETSLDLGLWKSPLMKRLVAPL